MLSVTGFDAGGSIEWIGGQIQQDDLNASTSLLRLAKIGAASGAPYARVSNTRFRRIFLTGFSARPNVALCGDTSVPFAGGGTIGNVPNSGRCP